MEDDMEDKGKETRNHIAQVQRRMRGVIADMEDRATYHDASKLEEPELTGFWEMNAISRRSDVVYGSPEYKALMDSQKPVIEHHYRVNDHHPEHWKFHAPAARTVLQPGTPEASGALISSMTLQALLEMLCDWDAASMRYKDGSFSKSFKGNCERFGIAPQIACILMNTAVYFGWMTYDDAQRIE